MTMYIANRDGRSEDVNMAHRNDFVLNYDFEDILDLLGDKEIGNILKKTLNQQVTLKLYIMHMFFLSLVLK